MYQLAVQLVGCADFYRGEGIEYIEFRDHCRIQAVELRNKTACNGIEPAAAARAACIRAILVTPVAHFLPRGIKEFRGHGAAADACDIRFVHTDYAINRMWR